jgi:hypothetical protein
VTARFLALPAAEVNGRPAESHKESHARSLAAQYNAGRDDFEDDFAAHGAIDPVRWPWAVVRVEDSPAASPAPLTDRIERMREHAILAHSWRDLPDMAEQADHHTDAVLESLPKLLEEIGSTLAALRAEVRDLTSRTERQSIANDKLAAGLGDEMATVAALTADLATARGERDALDANMWAAKKARDMAVERADAADRRCDVQIRDLATARAVAEEACTELDLRVAGGRSKKAKELRSRLTAGPGKEAP